MQSTRYKFRRYYSDIGRMSQYNIFKIKKKNGDFIFLESHGVPLRKYGEIYAIFGIRHEVTETINAERLVKASEIKYRNLFDQSPFGVSIYDSRGTLIESNRNIINKLAEYTGEDLPTSYRILRIQNNWRKYSLKDFDLFGSLKIH